MAGQRNPDIQRLLASLREGHLSPDRIQSRQATPDFVDSTLPQHSVDSADGSIPGLGSLSPPKRDPQPAPRSNTLTPQPHLQVTKITAVQERPATPVIPDASTITTWPAALKHVTKHIMANDKATDRIKHLISEQHKHEKQWWAGREAIVTRHSGRADNQAKVADLLKSLGGAAVPVNPHDPAADKAELQAYDKKVYKSLTDMTADFDRQLRRLQIPFFAVKHELVIVDKQTPGEGETKGKIDRGELRELQRRMIETLEDLLGDD